jgi:hypothetical protein
MFQETINGKNDAFHLDLFHLLSERSREDSLTKPSFQDRKDSFGHIPATIDFLVERAGHDLSVLTRDIRGMPVPDGDH